MSETVTVNINLDGIAPAPMVCGAADALAVILMTLAHRGEIDLPGLARDLAKWLQSAPADEPVLSEADEQRIQVWEAVLLRRVLRHLAWEAAKPGDHPAS